MAQEASLFDHLESADREAEQQRRKSLALTVHERLCKAYGCPVDYFHSLPPLAELVSSMLSHRTRNKDSGQAFRNLRAELPTWDEVADGEVARIELAISPCTWPEHKAPIVQTALRAVRANVGHLRENALDFLADLSVTQARAWLEVLPGVGRKTSAAVLSFSTLRMPALPVDSHHHRVAQRLGLIDAKVDVGPSHDELAALLPRDWNAQQVYDHHEVMMFHGQRVCHWRSPECQGCALLDLCPTGQEKVRER